ncbi:hypothetical protein [Lujinxingia sediminis]|uniref:hypothetical protein n=1 Tax=Lujinxingia sediminis TaxID=2480984 RepID=UPI0013E3A063|nr:hypothetical protein [Lujinxingia sediminis]
MTFSPSVLSLRARFTTTSAVLFGLAAGLVAPGTPTPLGWVKVGVGLVGLGRRARRG